jgi:hypothetical protein
MKRSQILWALAVLNAVLLVGLSWKLGGENQAKGNMMAAGDYIMLAGRVPGATSGVVYIIETRSKVLVPFVFDVNRGDFSVGQPINIDRIINGGGGVLNNGGRNPPRRP